MINRQNWQDVKAFLAFHEGTLQNDPLSVSRMRGALRHLLEWADDKPLGTVSRLEPTFPVHMARQKNEAGKPFSSSGSEKALSIARQFFNFARSEWSPRYKNISQSWVHTLQPSKRNSSQSRLKDHKHFGIENVLKIAELWESSKTLEIKRDVAAVCFLFLSGMRISAFTSLPLDCVNVKENEIFQLPEKGVMTKNRKAAVTHLLQVPKLLSIVTEWDNLVRSKLSDDDLWYPVMARGEDKFIPGRKACKNRGANFGERLQAICRAADVPYLSPHKIRHGHVVYALKNVKDMAGLKAVSQNVMHSSIQITDAVYGNFSSADVKRVVSSIGKSSGQADKTDSDTAQIKRILEIIKENPGLLSESGK